MKRITIIWPHSLLFAPVEGGSSSEFLSNNEKWIYPQQFPPGHSLVYFAADEHKHKVQTKAKISATQQGLSGCGSKVVDEQHQDRNK